MGLDQLSLSQMKYLLAIYRFQPKGWEVGGANMTKVAEFLGFSRPSVYNMISVLIDLNLIIKGMKGELKLTKKGTQVAEELDNKHSLITEFIIGNFDIERETAEKDAFIFLSEISQGLLDALLKEACQELRQGTLYDNKDTLDFSEILEDGVYSIPFHLLRFDEKRLSMGHKGFVYPCLLQVKGKKAEIYLQAKEITYKSIAGRNLSGKLSKLSYWNGNEFVKVCSQKDFYPIPVCSMELERDQVGRPRIGTIILRARATVGILNMRESEAKLKLNFAVAKKIRENEISLDKIVKL